MNYVILFGVYIVGCAAMLAATIRQARIAEKLTGGGDVE